MSELDDLYQAVILEHDRAPRNYGRLAHPTHCAEGYNPLCGDRLFVTLEASERIERIAFDAECCSIARASASLMTLAVSGRTVAEAAELGLSFEAMLRGKPATDLGDLAALGGVRRFPSRIRCATLSWHALRDALAIAPR
jgi:nitrogen fixation protein NifU and related proteins